MPQLSMNIKLFFIAFIISCTGCSMSQKESALFNFQEYQNVKKLNSKRDSSIVFINLIEDKKYSESEKIYPELFQIDVTDGIIKVKDEKPFLNGLGDYLNDYSNDSYDLLVLSVFLKNKYDTRIELYDKMLRGSLRLDSTNVPAMFLLAKLRYENGVEVDAHYLVNQMIKIEPDNKKIQTIQAYLNDRMGSLPSSEITFYEFLIGDIKYLVRD